MNDNIYEYIRSRMEKKMEIRRAGKNNNGTERILLYATKGTRLHDYAIYDSTYDDEGNESNKWRHFYRFPKDEIMEEDGYVCLYTDDSKTTAYIGGEKIKTFHMGLNNEKIFNKNGDKIFLIKISETSCKNTK